MQNRFAVNDPGEKNNQTTGQTTPTSGTPKPTSCCEPGCCGGKKPVNLRITM